MTGGSIVWLKNDIRLWDHSAIANAIRTSVQSPILAMIWTPNMDVGLIPKTAKRKALENREIRRLADDMRAGAAPFPLLQADQTPEDILPMFCSEMGANVLHAIQETGDLLTYQRDMKVTNRLAHSGVRLIEYAEGGICRGRNKDKGHVLQDDPFNLKQTPDSIRRLRDFLHDLPRLGYRANMWNASKGGDATSRLSVDLAMGTISASRILFETQEYLKKLPEPQHQPYLQFRARLHWRQSFIQIYETDWRWFPAHIPNLTESEQSRFDQWQSHKTGIPIIDAAMLELSETGWTNFRLRQTLASFAIDLLQLPWEAVAAEIGRRFDDFTPGIHWPQIALQAGLLAPERGPRIVNPLKQARDLDPHETYVRKWLPELKSLPKGFAHEPWKHPGWKGSPPMIHVPKAMKEAADRWKTRTATKRANSENRRKAEQASLFD